MLERSATRFLRLLGELVRHDVEFIVVGGVAGVLAGSPLPTMDLDIVPDPDPANLERLLAVLTTLGARYRDPAGREIVPDLAKLASFDTNLLVTELGALDVLRVIGDGLEFRDLRHRVTEYEVAGLRIRALDLPALIETKESANRPKDHKDLLFLRQLRDMQEDS